MTTYVNAIQPLYQLFDGFLIHSRGAGGTALFASRVCRRLGAEPDLHLERLVSRALFRRHEQWRDLYQHRRSMYRWR